jgi:hypothetical protein
MAITRQQCQQIIEGFIDSMRSTGANNFRRIGKVASAVPHPLGKLIGLGAEFQAGLIDPEEEEEE